MNKKPVFRWVHKKRLWRYVGKQGVVYGVTPQVTWARYIERCEENRRIKREVKRQIRQTPMSYYL